MERVKGKQKRDYLALKALIEDQVLEARDDQYEQLLNDFIDFKHQRAIRSNSLHETKKTTTEDKEKATKKYTCKIHFEKWILENPKASTAIIEYLSVKDFSRLSSTCKVLREIYFKSDWAYFFERDFKSFYYLEHDLNRSMCMESYKSMIWCNFVKNNTKKIPFINVCCDEFESKKQKLNLEILINSMRDVAIFKTTSSFDQKHLWISKNDLGSAYFCLSLLKEHKSMVLWQLKAAIKTSLPTHRIYSQFSFKELPNADQMDCMFINEQRILVQINTQNLRIYNIEKFSPNEFVADMSTKHDISITVDNSRITFEKLSSEGQKNGEKAKAIIDLRSQEVEKAEEADQSMLPAESKEKIQLRLEDFLKIETENYAIIMLYWKEKNLIFKIDARTETEELQIIHLSLEEGVYVKEFKRDLAGEKQIISNVTLLLCVDSLSRMHKISINNLENKAGNTYSIKPDMIFDPFANNPSQRDKIKSQPTKIHEFFTYYPDEDYLISSEACLFLIDAEKARFQLVQLSSLKSTLFEVPPLFTHGEDYSEAGHVRDFRITNNCLIYFRGNVMLSIPLEPSKLNKNNISICRSSLESAQIPASFVHIAKLESYICFVRINSEGIYCEALPFGRFELINKTQKSQLENKRQLKKITEKAPNQQNKVEVDIKDYPFEYVVPNHKVEFWERKFYRQRYAATLGASLVIDYRFSKHESADKDQEKKQQNSQKSVTLQKNLAKIQNLVVEHGNKLLLRLPEGSFFLDLDLLVSRIDSVQKPPALEEEVFKSKYLVNHRELKPNTNHESNPQARETLVKNNEEETKSEDKEGTKMYRTKTALRKAQKGLPKEKRKAFNPDYHSDDEKEINEIKKEDKFSVIVDRNDIWIYKKDHKQRVIKRGQKTGQSEKKLAKVGLIDLLYS